MKRIIKIKYFGEGLGFAAEVPWAKAAGWVPEHNWPTMLNALFPDVREKVCEALAKWREHLSDDETEYWEVEYGG